MADSPPSFEADGSREDLISEHDPILEHGTPDPDYDVEFPTDKADEGHPTAMNLDEGYQTGPGAAAPTSPASGEEASSDEKKHLPAVEGLGRGVNKLMETINHLRTLGVEDIVAPLPKVVVVGDQSAGKSSLIEAISEIKVPRSAGTCTRCPLEINLKTDDEWRCKVSLRQKYIYYPVEAPAKGTSQKNTPGRHGPASTQKGGAGRASAKTRSSGQPARTFEHFIVQDAVDYPFKEVDDPSELEDVLSWAQSATLHPNEDYRNYIPDENGNTNAQLEEPQLKFSPNIVRLDITGPRLPNLSFYDLPGVINRSEDMDEMHLVATVRNLVKEYIGKDNSLVLLAQSMNNDPNVSSAAELVEQMNAKERCIGVLTKPDLIGHRKTFPLWKKVLDNSNFSLKHKYYVTKQPDQDCLDSGVDHAEARVREKEFFETVEPWASEFAEFSERFGTERLQSALSEKLTFQILASIDDIKKKVRQKAEQVESELLGLPDPPSDNLPILLDRALERFNQQVQRGLTGGNPEIIFQLSWNKLAKQFLAAISGTMPNLAGLNSTTKPSTEVPESPKRPAKVAANPPATPSTTQRSETIELDASDDETPTPTPSNNKKRPAAQTAGTPAKRQKLAQPRRDGPFAATYALGKRFTIMDLRNHIARYCTNSLSNLTNPQAVFELCSQSILHWEEILRIFLDKTGDLIRREMFDRLQDVFDKYKQTGLYDELTAAIDGLLAEAMDQMRDSGGALYQAEFFKPAILDDDALEAATTEASIKLQQARRDQRVNAYLDKLEQRTGKPIEGQERASKAARVTDDQIGPDPFAKEVKTLAKVQAYYKLAKTRFTESLFVNLQAHTFGKIQNVLIPVLERRLGLLEEDALERCRRLMVEDPQREIRRAQLKKDKERLNQALECLARLEMPK